MDFLGGEQLHAPRAHRLHRGRLEGPRVMAGLEKPIFNPREPHWLAQVGISPLTGAGNLWLWLPQVRLEQTFLRCNGSHRHGAHRTPADPRGRPFRGARLERAARRRASGVGGPLQLLPPPGRRAPPRNRAGFHTSTRTRAGFSVPSRTVLDGLVFQCHGSA